MWGYGFEDASIVYHEMFDMKTRLTNNITLRPGDVVIDGGANLGFFSMSLLAEAKVPKDVTVHAFEPIPATYQAAKMNLEGQPRVTLHNMVRF